MIDHRAKKWAWIYATICVFTFANRPLQGENTDVNALIKIVNGVPCLQVSVPNGGSEDGREMFDFVFYSANLPECGIDRKAIEFFSDKQNPNVRIATDEDGNITGCTIEQVAIAGHKRRSSNFKPVDMRVTCAYIGDIVLGLVDFSYFQKDIVTIDYENSRFLASNSQQIGKDAKTIECTWASNGEPVVKASIDDVDPGLFAIDTTSTWEVLLWDHDYITALKNGGELAKNIKFLQEEDWADSDNPTFFRSSRLRVGDTIVTDPICAYSPVKPPQYGDDPVIGVLGAEFLRRFTVTFDRKANCIYLVPNSMFGERSEFDMSGMWLLALGSRMVVSDVIFGSPAALGGIKQDDEIVMINGIETKFLSLSKIRDMLKAGDGKEVPLVLRRGDAEINVTITLKQVL